MDLKISSSPLLLLLIAREQRETATQSEGGDDGTTVKMTQREKNYRDIDRGRNCISRPTLPLCPALFFFFCLVCGRLGRDHFFAVTRETTSQAKESKGQHTKKKKTHLQSATKMFQQQR